MEPTRRHFGCRRGWLQPAHGADEARTLASLKERPRNILNPLEARREGRIFKVTGDGVLVEPSSAVNAVQCAVDLQRSK
jgi:class 3 adenylate cyclase